jgi:sRNA-binding carbon storage regulator CsrA
MLYLDLSVGDRLVIDDGRISVSLEKSKGANKFRFGVDAPKSVPVRVDSGKNNSYIARGLSKNFLTV